MDATPVAPPPSPPRQQQKPLVKSNVENDRFRRGIKISLFIHGFLFIGGVITNLALPGKPVAYIPSVRVDLVGLPDIKKSDAHKTSTSELEKLSQKLTAADKTLKQEQQKKKALEVVKPPEPPAAMTLKDKTKEKTKDTSPTTAAPKEDRRKHLSSAIDRIRALQAMEESVDDGKSQEKTKAPAKGNLLSKGSQNSGSETGDINAFVDSLVSRIRENWDLPLWLSKQKFSAKVLLRINSSGGVGQIVFVKESGNEQFDQYVRNTINKSAPFGTPPADIESDGIMLGFPL